MRITQKLVQHSCIFYFLFYSHIYFVLKSSLCLFDFVKNPKKQELIHICPTVWHVCVCVIDDKELFQKHVFSSMDLKMFNFNKKNP